MLCPLPNSWDYLMMVIGSTTTQLKMDQIVDALVSKEMQRKSSEVSKEVLIIQGRVNDKRKKGMKPKCSRKKSKVKC